jgi:hypothetical protein
LDLGHIPKFAVETFLVPSISNKEYVAYSTDDKQQPPDPHLNFVVERFLLADEAKCLCFFPSRFGMERNGRR